MISDDDAELGQICRHGLVAELLARVKAADATTVIQGLICRQGLLMDRIQHRNEHGKSTTLK